MIKSPGRVIPLFIAREEQYAINPKTGRLRSINNDVELAIDLLGGVQATASKFSVDEDEVEKWIDEYYIPTEFAAEVSKDTKIQIVLLQEPSGYLVDEEMNIIWPPHPPTVDVFIPDGRRKKNPGRKVSFW
jgi:hypothetical protein